jgi:pyrimidine-nucleoside phosphorylase
MPELRELIRRKRHGGALDAAELRWLVDEAVAGRVPDYQLAAWLMACCFTHLNATETLALTAAFVGSGEQLVWNNVTRPLVDKHSTGGVGDKVSLALAPWLAAAGLALPKMSGRGLGHTGGTLDKLAAIPGFRTDLDQPAMQRLLDSVGCCIAAQSPTLVPADKLFYALRDATETVDELGLIVASIMSKKLACGAQHIVLDVKCGSGAFFPNPPAAQAFAAMAARIGREAGRNVACVIAPMEQPLGRAVGNALEVQEAAGLLSGGQDSPELRAACLELGVAALELVHGATADHGTLLLDLLESGAAWESFQRWVAAQGGDWAAFEHGAASAAAHYRQVTVTATSAGRLERLDALTVGLLACDLGAGRRNKEDVIDPWVGVECLAKVGDSVEPGQELARLTVMPQEPRTDEQLAAAYLAAAGFAV